jgi:hypothetical protein
VPDPEADGAALRTLVAAQAANRTNLTRQATAMATQAARTFHHWYETDAITEWATKLAGRIEALQRNQAQTTDAYLARAVSQLIGKRVRPVGRVDVSGLRDGITHAGAYGRAADVYRWRQSQVDQFARKLADADIRRHPDPVSGVELRLPDSRTRSKPRSQRIAAVADLDMQLADRAQSHRFLTEHADQLNITGQRRVIHPELSKGGTCGLCIAASDRVYHPGELRPIHGHCECTTLPIVDGRDPGAGLNGLDLKTLYGNAGNSTSAAALKRTRYKIDEHGELGPVLTERSTVPHREAGTPRHPAVDRGQPVPRSKASLASGCLRWSSARRDGARAREERSEAWDRYAAVPRRPDRRPAGAARRLTQRPASTGWQRNGRATGRTRRRAHGRTHAHGTADPTPGPPAYRQAAPRGVRVAEDGPGVWPILGAEDPPEPPKAPEPPAYTPPASQADLDRIVEQRLARERRSTRTTTRSRPRPRSTTSSRNDAGHGQGEGREEAARRAPEAGARPRPPRGS